MKNIKRAVSSVMSLMLCVALLLLAGCGAEQLAVPDYNQPQEISTLKTTCVAENVRYSLIWDATAKRVILYDKVEDCEWSYVPQDALDKRYDEDGYEKTNHPYLESPILIRCHNAQSLMEIAQPIAASTRSINKGTCSLTKIENGLEMMCYFPDYSIAVPVLFTLKDDGVDISVDVDRIQENGSEYSITSITIAPLLCSISNENANKDDHYLFMPSGSGTVIRPSSSPDPEDTTYETITEKVYGGDANVEKPSAETVTEAVRMPVYGAVNGNKGACAIITEGAECAYLNTTLGWKVTGYSYINPEFIIRGQQKTVQALFTSSAPRQYTLYSDYFVSGKISVSFKPLYNEDASYVGMAKKYREYLEEKEAIKKTEDEKLLNLKIYGGIKTKKFVFGIPSDDMLVATTLNQAQSIVSELKEETGESINANLIGFGQSGADIGAIAGNYAINSKFGNKKDMLSLTEYCANNGIDLFMNFDMVRFNADGGGVSTLLDKTKSATGDTTNQYYYDVVFRSASNVFSKYYLVSRTKYNEIATNIKDAASKWNLGGVSLDSLTSIVYSDFNDRAYYSAANFEKQAANVVNGFKEAGYNVAGSDANAFIAGLCDHVYDIPTKSSKYRAYTADVPFYQIVFKGNVSMSVTSLNLATSAETTLLNAVETGAGLSYTVIGQFNTNLISSAQNVFYGSLYWNDTLGTGVKDIIIKDIAEYKDFFYSVKGAGISDHKIISENVRMTKFDNGVTVYVNYGDTAETVDEIEIPARSYKVK